MLNKRQLEDAAKCSLLNRRECKECDIRVQCGIVCTEQAAKTALALYDILKLLEYSKIDTPNGIIHEVCPMCEHEEHEGHDKDCKLGNLLKEVEG